MGGFSSFVDPVFMYGIHSLFLLTSPKTKKKEPSLFEIILNPEGVLQEEKEEPSLFEVVLQPEKFVQEEANNNDYNDAENQIGDGQEDEEAKNPLDYPDFRYEFTSGSTTVSTTTTTTTTTTSASTEAGSRIYFRSSKMNF